jgi:hypothetical protein
MSLNPAVFKPPVWPTVAAVTCAIELALSVSPADPPGRILGVLTGHGSGKLPSRPGNGHLLHTFADLRSDGAWIDR